MAPTFGLIGELLDALPHIVPLEHVEVKVKIRSFVASVLLKLVYRNDKSSPIQATYRCPIDVNAAVFHFEAKFEKTVIKATCFEKKKAKKMYKEAVESGKTAILAGEDDRTSDILEIYLGNVPPDEIVEIQLHLVQELTVGTAGDVTFTLPTVFHPRYTPASGPDPPEPPYNWVTEIATLKPYTMCIEAEVIGCHKILEIKSFKDDITVDISTDELSAKVTQDEKFTMDHDWTMHVFFKNPYQVHLIRETGDHTASGFMQDDLLAVNYFPELPVNAFSPHNELIFVIDRSGSMNGERIASSRAALLLFLKSLPPGCRFNIVSFGSHFTTLFSEPSVRYTESTLQTALELQKTMDSDMGGTEILEALKHVYSQPSSPGYNRQVIVITDGAVFNVDSVLELVARNAENTRVFSVGIGEGASTALVEGIAKAGRGRHEMVFKTEHLQAKVMGLVASMLQFSVTEFQLTCKLEGSSEAKLMPKVPPIIFGGQHLLLYARIPPKSVIGDLSMLGKVGEKSLNWQLKEEDVRTVHDSNLSMHRLAAKAQIKQWELHQDDFKDEVIELSCSTNVLSKYTAMVGINEDGDVHKQLEPVAPQMDTGGFRSAFGAQSYTVSHMSRKNVSGNMQFLACASTCAAPPGVPQAQAFGGVNYPPPPAPPRQPRRHERVCNERAIESVGSTEEDEECFDTVKELPGGTGSHGFGTTDSDKLMELVSKQSFNGSWNLDDIKGLLSNYLTLELLKDFSYENESVLATLCAVAVMRHGFADRRAEWNLIEIKAVSFLQMDSAQVEKEVGKIIDLFKSSQKN